MMSSNHLLQTSYLIFVGTASFVGIRPSGSGKWRRRLHGRNATTTSGSLPRTCWEKAVWHRHLQPSRLARPTPTSMSHLLISSTHHLGCLLLLFQNLTVPWRWLPSLRRSWPVLSGSLNHPLPLHLWTASPT